MPPRSIEVLSTRPASGHALPLKLLVLVLLVGSTGCEDPYCMDSECGYGVQPASIVAGPTYEGFPNFPSVECPANTVLKWHRKGFFEESDACRIEAYWGSMEPEGATIDVVQTADLGGQVKATVTVTVPGTGVWAEPSVLSIVFGGDFGGYGYTTENILYPGGLNFTYAMERTFSKQLNAKFGLVRTEDSSRKYKYGASQSREVTLTPARVWATIRRAP